MPDMIYQARNESPVAAIRSWESAATSEFPSDDPHLFSAHVLSSVASLSLLL